MRTRAFRGLVPAPGRAPEVAAVPYDVVSSEEARALAGNRAHDLLHVDRAEIDLPPGTDPYSAEVYSKARESFVRLQQEGILVREPDPTVYVYRQTMGDHVQTGVAVACHIDDYANDVIRKHEKTRPVKEDDRTRLADTLSAHTGPIFLTYRDQGAIDDAVASVTESGATVDFVDETGVRHQVWPVVGGASLLEAFGRVPVAYVADGHHRSASAYRVGAERRAANPSHTGEEDYNWFLGVLFPASQLKILAYNRVVKDLNGQNASDFLEAASRDLRVEPTENPQPGGPGVACMYLDGRWYSVSLPGPEEGDPVAELDVSRLHHHLLEPLLGVGDPRTDERIDFVGGVRGTGELERRVDGGEWAVAFSLHPVTVDQLMAISDAGSIMPPKSTWFEPKLRSGLFIYTF